MTPAWSFFDFLVDLRKLLILTQLGAAQPQTETPEKVQIPTVQHSSAKPWKPASRGRYSSEGTHVNEDQL